MIQWRFPSNDHGENKGINDSGVATFRGTPIKSLAREICQNSLDAARNKTVIIEFNVFTIPTSSLPGVDALKDTFERCRDFWSIQKASATKDFFDNAIKHIEEPTCTMLRISDFNTSGLLGSREEINTDWTNLTKSSGASDKKGTAGGSYGIGKYAPFACSDFATVFYSTYDEKEQVAYQGVSRLVTFKRSDDNETTQGIGYYGEEYNKPVYEQLQLEPSFSRNKGQYGTDIYICGYKTTEDSWQKQILVSILDGFLGALWKEKLIIKIGDIVVSKDTLGNLIEEYNEDLTGNTKKYYELLCSEDTTWTDGDIYGLGNVSLGLLLGDGEASRKVAMIRKTGMKILEKDRLQSHVPFTGIMFIEGDALNEKLRQIENPEHTEWQPDRSPNPIQARKILSALYDFIKEKLKELIMHSSRDEIDAVGVGNFLPDEDINEKNESPDEVVSDRVVDVEKTIIRKKNIHGQKPGNDEAEKTDSENTNDSHEELGGDNHGRIHTGGTINGDIPNSLQNVNHVAGGQSQTPQKEEVALKKFVPICIDMNQGIYVFSITPATDTDRGSIELYMSAETEKYKAPIISATTIIGNNEITVKNGVLEGLKFEKDKPLRIKVQLDYHDYCSMEVKIYASQE